MKYTSDHPPLQCFMRQSTWYNSVGPVAVKGVLWHSTGANNPYVSRYVQPDDNAPDREELLKLLGVNRYKNDWNHTTRQAGVHAFVGKLTSGAVAAIQTGEWNKKAWGCGSGKKGSCNNGWIQFEICEDGLEDPVYFGQVYREAVELTAYLCQLYNLDPKGTVTYNGVRAPVILCHQDSYQLGLGSNHADVLHWLPKFGKSMEDVRNDVYDLLQEDNEVLSYERWKAYMDRYRAELAARPGPEYGVDELTQAVELGITDGSRPCDLATRQEVMSMIVRAKNT